MRAIVLAGVIGVSVALGGCSLFRSACDKALPVLVESQSLAFEAQAALLDATKAIENSNLSDAHKAKAAQAILTAQESLKAAAASMAALSNACTAPDIEVLFEGFLTAWDVIRRFLPLIGGEGMQVEDPTVYRMSRG